MSQQQKISVLDFSKRLRAAREILGITQDSLGKAWGVDGNYIYILESGKRGFPKKWQIKVIDLEDQVRRKFEDRNLPLLMPEKGAPPYGIRDDGAEKRLSPTDTTVSETPMAGDVRESDSDLLLMRKVPVVGFVAGANFLGNRMFDYSDMANQIEEQIATDSRDPNALGLIVEGDSMDPEYQEGDRIVVAPNAEPRNRDVVVARLKVEGSAMLKRFFRTGPEGKTIRLESTNPNYSPIVKELSEFRFIYPVVDMRRKPRR